MLIQKKLEEQGYIVLNPVELPEGMKPTSYMNICIPMLQEADAIYLLKNWRSSQGANIERAFAEYQGKEILYEESF